MRPEIFRTAASGLLWAEGNEAACALDSPRIRLHSHCLLMADKTQKFEENVAGRFYVDQQCIDCDLCRETAPDFFTRNEDGGFSFVYRQPQTDDDISLCMEALEGCPVDAIGADGDDTAASVAQSGQAAE